MTPPFFKAMAGQRGQITLLRMGRGMKANVAKIDRGAWRWDKGFACRTGEGPQICDGFKERPGNPPGTRGPLRLRSGPLGLKANGILAQRLL